MAVQDAMADSLGSRFRTWLMAQELDGFAVSTADEDHVLFAGQAAQGQVNFYRMTDEVSSPEIVEMRIRQSGADEDSFFLHFMLDDMARACELFREMTEALAELGASKVDRVLLCCTCGVTTTFFASKMNEVAQGLGINLTFEAHPLEVAVRSGGSFSAVMLAPQVANQRQRVAQAFPQAAVFEIPARLFGSYNAAGAVRLACSVLDRSQSLAQTTPDDLPLPKKSELIWGGRILVVSAVLGTKQSSVEWRVYENGQAQLSGKSTKRQFSFRDVEDVFAAVRMGGVDIAHIDAVGIAIPGVIKDGNVSLKVDDVRDYELADHIEKAHGVKVYLDNDANAAAIGCYVTQEDYRSVAYHRQDYGAVICGQGSVVDGRLVRGNGNFAGELGYLVRTLNLSAPVDDLVWTEEGMYEVVGSYLLCNTCVLSPEAIYVDAWPASDMDRLRALIAAQAGEENTPSLLRAPDFNECIFTGELALCIQRLRRDGPRTTSPFSYSSYLMNK